MMQPSQPLGGTDSKDKSRKGCEAEDQVKDVKHGVTPGGWTPRMPP